MCRIGVHAWSPSYRGLGVEIATASQVAVAGVGEAGDQATLNCVGRMWCPLRPDVLGDELDELDTLTVTRCWYEFWTDSVDEIEDTSTITPVKRLKRSTAIGAQTVGWGESPDAMLGAGLGSRRFPTTTTIHPRPGGAGADQNRRVLREAYGGTHVARPRFLLRRQRRRRLWCWRDAKSIKISRGLVAG